MTQMIVIYSRCFRNSEGEKVNFMLKLGEHRDNYRRLLQGS